MDYDRGNQSSSGRPDYESTIKYLEPDEVHADEIVNGRVSFDEWSCGFPGVVVIDVDQPQPIPKVLEAKQRWWARGADEPVGGETVVFAKTMGTKYLQAVKRRYVFTGERDQVVKIPSVYRMAVRHVVNGVVMGGQMPKAVLLGCESQPTVHPALVEQTGPSAPPAPQAGTAEHPVVSSALAPPDNATAEERALKRARERRGAA